MTPLGKEIAAMIAEDGPMSVERFMTLAAMHPQYGYYRSHMPIGARGDFITAPEIHQMFGELIGIWAAEVWHAMGEPAPVRLVELGPGRGTLMADLLRAARVAPAFRQALDVNLVEMSEPLIEEQRRTLASVADIPIVWHESVESLPVGPTIIIANEFFDALPVRHYVRVPSGWCERVVGLDADGALCFGLAAAPQSGPAAASDAAPEVGTIVEIGLVAQRLMGRLAGHIAADCGALLVIDYGHARTRPGATLQAVKGHRATDPLREPGEADLTAHVDFAALSRAATAAGASVYGPVPQGTFLARIGLFERATALKRKADPSQVAAIDAAVERLATPGKGAEVSMAELFKVLAVTSPDLGPPPGFGGPAVQ
ncbi:MAG TPA: SAM-dependent methyltransferase [Methylovirgula sp.]|nr:SAM-dependent methyltransferase [Methylovirgula sp.]